MSDRRRDLATAVIGTVGSRLVWLISIPLVARLYSPTDVGTWPLVTAVAAIVAVLGTWRLEIAVTIAHYTPRARSLALFTIALTILFTLTVGIAIAVFPNVAAAMLGLNDLGAILFACPAFILLNNINAIFQAWLLRAKAISAITIGNSLNPIATVSSLLLFAGTTGPSSGAFVAGQLLGLTTTMIVFAIAAIKSGLIDRPIAFSLRAVANSISFYRVYPLYTVPQTLAIVVSERLIQLWIAGAYSVESLGIFYLARQVLVSPVLAVTAPVGQLVFANLARILAASERRKFILPFFETSAGAAGLAIGLGIKLAPILFPVLLGSKFSAAADYSQWLVLGVSMLIVIGWAERSFDVSRRAAVAFVMNSVHSAFIVGAILISYAFKLAMSEFVLAYGVAGFLGYVLFAVAVMKALEFSAGAIGKAMAFLAGGLVGGYSISSVALAILPGLSGVLLASAVTVPIGLILFTMLWRKL